MRAVRQHAFGEPEVLRCEDVPSPHPGPGQARVAVAAAGVHLVDTVARRGELMDASAPAPLPIVPGREVGGVVEAVGSAEDRGWVGRRVVAHLGAIEGGYAERALAPVARLHALDDDTDPADAVAVIGTGRTAAGVLELARLEPGDTLLVLAAAGGLGSLLVQAGRMLAGHVVGAAGGAAKAAAVDRLGAVAVDYRDDGWVQRLESALDGRRLRVVIDMVGGDAGRAAHARLAPEGRHLVIDGVALDDAAPAAAADTPDRGPTVVRGVPAYLQRRPGGMRDLEERALAWLRNGWWSPVLSRFALCDAAAAHRALESRDVLGKVVLTP